MNSMDFDAFRIEDGEWKKVGKVIITHRCRFIGENGEVLFESPTPKVTEFTKEVKKRYHGTVLVPSWEYMRNIKYPDDNVKICETCGKKVALRDGMCKKCLDELDASNERLRKMKEDERIQETG